MELTHASLLSLLFNSFNHKKMDISNNQDHRFGYMLLGRLVEDCKYYLDHKGTEKDLWSGGVEQQIYNMKELYDTVPVKPEWLTDQQLRDIIKQMEIEKRFRDAARDNIQASNVDYYLDRSRRSCCMSTTEPDMLQYTKVDTSRISSIYIYKDSQSDRHRLRCKIDGEQCISVLLNKQQDMYWEGAKMHNLKEAGKILLACEVHAETLLHPVGWTRQQEPGLSR